MILKRYSVLLLILLLPTGSCLKREFFSPYVTFKEAKNNGGKYVQVIGKLDISVPIKNDEGKTVLTLIDEEKTVLTAVHAGTMPVNFQHAEKIVLLGRYNSEIGVFDADRVLVKCPSKYQKKM